MIWTVTFNPSRDMTFVLDGPLEPGSIQVACSIYARSGGKGNNVARVVRRLGQPVGAVGFYGGATGELVGSGLQEQGIEVLGEPIAGETRICLTIVGSGGSEITEIREKGPPVPPAAAERLLRRLLERVQREDWVTLSGSLPPELPASVWADWVRALNPRCRGVLVDTGAENLRAAISARPLVMVPNRDEWRASGLSVTDSVVVTEGANGVTCYPTPGVVRRLRPPKVAVANTVGAGDAFLGGMVDGLSRGESWERALVWAVAVAAASVTSPGVADVDPLLARSLVPQVVVE